MRQAANEKSDFNFFQCLRAAYTCAILLYTIHLTALPAFLNVMLLQYATINYFVAATTRTRPNPAYTIALSLPFILYTCILVPFTWIEWLGSVTFALPLLQSFGLVPVTTSNLALSFGCQMVILEYLVHVFQRTKYKDSLWILYSSIALVSAFYIACVVQPVLVRVVVLNPLFGFIMAVGAVVLNETRNYTEVCFSMVYASSAC